MRIAPSGMHASFFWRVAFGNMAAPQTPPTRPEPMMSTPPPVPVQRYVLAGVIFVNAISNRMIFEVDQRMPIWAAIREVSSRAGVGIGQVRFFNERGAVTFLEDIDDPVIFVVLLTE